MSKLERKKELILFSLVIPLVVILSGPFGTNAAEPIYPPISDSMYHYSAFYSGTQTGSALSSTIVSPVGAARRVFLEGVTIESSAACVFNIEMYGTNPTATLITTTPLNTSIIAEARAYGPSNVGSGSVVTQISLPADGVRTVELPGVVLSSGSSLARNISVVPQCTSGTVRYTWKFAHQRVQ